jgi:hypothetical protein
MVCATVKRRQEIGGSQQEAISGGLNPPLIVDHQIKDLVGACTQLDKAAPPGHEIWYLIDKSTSCLLTSRLLPRPKGLVSVGDGIKVSDEEPDNFPSTLGYEAAGVIDAVGEGVTQFKIGDRISTIPGFSIKNYGVYGESAIAPAAMVAKYPEKLSPHFDRTKYDFIVIE